MLIISSLQILFVGIIVVAEHHLDRGDEGSHVLHLLVSLFIQLLQPRRIELVVFVILDILLNFKEDSLHFVI